MPASPSDHFFFCERSGARQPGTGKAKEVVFLLYANPVASSVFFIDRAVVTHGKVSVFFLSRKRA
jgi:hypothetical protein